MVNVCLPDNKLAKVMISESPQNISEAKFRWKNSLNYIVTVKYSLCVVYITLSITVSMCIWYWFAGVLRYPSVADYNNLNYFRSWISVLSDGSLLAGAM